MPITRDHWAIATAIVAMVAFNAVFLSANGLFMIVAPVTWYESVPGVTDTGFFNQHFIRDIGIIQLFLGIVLTLWAIRRSHAAAPATA